MQETADTFPPQQPMGPHVYEDTRAHYKLLSSDNNTNRNPAHSYSMTVQEHRKMIRFQYTLSAQGINFRTVRDPRCTMLHT